MVWDYCRFYNGSNHLIQCIVHTGLDVCSFDAVDVYMLVDCCFFVYSSLDLELPMQSMHIATNVVGISLRRYVLDTTLCDKVCHWLAAGRWFYPSTPVSSTNKTERYDITEILLKVALNTITITLIKRRTVKHNMIQKQIKQKQKTIHSSTKTFTRTAHSWRATYTLRRIIQPWRATNTPGRTIHSWRAT